MKAYEIVRELEELLEAELMEDGNYVIPATGEMMTQEELGEALKGMEVAKKEKLNNCCGFIANLNGDNDVIEREINRLQAIKKANENKKNFVKNFVIPLLTDGEKWKSETHSVSYRTNKSVEVLVNAEDLPKEYRKVTYEAKKTELKKAIESGVIGENIAKIVESKSTIVK